MSTQSQPRVLATSHGKRKDTLGRSTTVARRWADTFECTGSPAARHGAESNVVRGDACRPRSAAVSSKRYASGDALLPSSPGGPLYDCDWFMAATYNFGDPYLYGVTSVTWVTMGIRGITCGLRANQETSRFPIELSDWPPKCGAVR